MRYRALAIGIATLVGAATLTGCEEGSTILRSDEAQVLTGANLPTLSNPLAPVTPSAIVGFAYVTVDEVPHWRQIPVQVDERKVVPYGAAPPNINPPAGVVGTVYGMASPTVLTTVQYADAKTFVGADSNPAFDTDDELVFMVADAGGERPTGTPDPAGVVAGSGVRVALTDSLDPAGAGSVYLFRSAGGLVPSAGKDYVNYHFDLVAGGTDPNSEEAHYKDLYVRGHGPNPEVSKVTTASYEIGFTDRWMETSWRSLDPSSTGVDMLDGFKTQYDVKTVFLPDEANVNCFRGNESFRTSEGAFVANIDGPVRGIRSYVGANSGERTQRTHIMYRQHEEIVTDLRVHILPANARLADFADFSAAATEMEYRSSTVPDGVAIDGSPDSVSTEPPSWEAVTGPHGSVLMATEFETTNLTNFEESMEWFYLDENAPTLASCGGDDGAVLGGAGPKLNSYGPGGFPNTDPLLAGALPLRPLASMRATRTVVFGGVPPDVSIVGDVGEAWAEQVRTPLTVSVSPT